MLGKPVVEPRDCEFLAQAVNAETASAALRPTVRARTVDGITIVKVLNAETLFEESAIACSSDQLRRLVEAGHTRMVLDLRGVRWISSDVLSTLAGLHLRLERLGGRPGLLRAL